MKPLFAVLATFALASPLAGQSGTLENGYTYVSPLAVILTVTPSVGPNTGGDVVTVVGENFLEGVTVSFGGVMSLDVTYNSPTSLTVITPPHANGTVDVVVTNLPDDQLPEPPSESPVGILTDSLPHGTVGVPYSAQLEATGGDGNYIWRISSGELPAGLVLDSLTGIISGTPTTADPVVTEVRRG
jgi:hypothetical protein